MKVLSPGDRLLRILTALANPHRLRVVAALDRRGRTYVSELAREIGISRPLMHLHLKKLEAAGLVESRLELSGDGKALNYYELAELDMPLTSQTIAAAADTLSL